MNEGRNKKRKEEREEGRKKNSIWILVAAVLANFMPT